MKKLLSLLLAVMMLLGCIPAMADAEWKINQYTGLVSRKSAAEKLENIVVPAEVDGVAVRGIEYMAFNMYKDFKTLTISDSAVILDRGVVRMLNKLETIDLPENLLVIREDNFYDLPKLTSVVIPASVALVRSSFNKCESLQSITFEGMCPVFAAEDQFGMFNNLPAECVIYVPDNQVDAYKAAFANREDVLPRIQPSGQYASPIDWTAPESDFKFDASTGTITGYTGTANYLKIPTTIGGVQVKHIADYAFTRAYSLCYLVIPEGVETVGEYCFAGANLLSYVSLPSTLVSIGSNAFSSARMTAISYNGNAVPSFDASAFKGVDGDWQITLPYGSSQELLDAFAAYVAEAAPKCLIRASIIEPYKFPALDAEAGAPYIGNWNAVAVNDGTDFYGMDLLGMSMSFALNADGTGSVDMDVDSTTGAWYVENGEAIFAPILEEGGQPVPEEAMPLTLDENGRMCLDLMGLIALMEKEGATYAVPAIPEKPWPELDADKAKAYLGTWDAVSYVMDGETYAAELVGPATLILNADGTAHMTEGGEEGYELRWYADTYSAYVGPAMSALAELYFDMNGNLQMKQDGSKIIFAPHVEATPVPTPEPTPVPTPEPTVNPTAGGEHLLGDWYDDLGNKLTLAADGTMTYTYASDGWTDNDKWAVVDGEAVVTAGRWEGAAIYLRDGIVFIDNDEGIFQLFSVDGDLSAYYGEDDEDEMAVAQPIGDEGAAYFGAWKGDMFGMEVILTLNQDGTCAMEMMGEAEPGVWAVVDGKANIMGDEIFVDGDGNLVFESMGIVFTKADAEEAAGNDGEMSEEEQMLALLAMLAQMAEQEGAGEAEQPQSGFSYEDTTFVLTKAATVFNGQSYPVDAAAFGEYNVRFNGNGSAEVVQSGLALPSEYLTWSVNDQGQYVIDYSVNGAHVMEYVFNTIENGVTMDYYGTLMTFTPAE